MSRVQLGGDGTILFAEKRRKELVSGNSTTPKNIQSETN